MDSQIAGQIGVAAILILVGVSGWLLPYRWNILRLKRSFARNFSDNVNRAFPKVLGTIFIVAGLVILLGTAIIGRFE